MALCLECLLLIAALTSIPALAQNETGVGVFSQWLPGDETVVDVVQGKREYRQDSRIAADSGTVRFRITVLDTMDDGYTVLWAPESVRLPVVSGKEPDLLSLVGFVGNGVIVRTTASGAFDRIQNMTEISLTVAKALDSVATTHNDPETSRKTSALIDYLLRTDVLEKSLAEPMRYYYLLHGDTYVVGEDRTYFSELPDFSGTGTIRAHGKTVLHQPSEGGHITLVNTLTADSADLRAAMLRKLSLYGKTPESGFVGHLSLRDRNVLKMDPERCLPYEIDHIREVTSGTYRVEKFLSIRQVSATVADGWRTRRPGSPSSAAALPPPNNPALATPE